MTQLPPRPEEFSQDPFFQTPGAGADASSYPPPADYPSNNYRSSQENLKTARKTTPFVTWAIIGICALMYLLQLSSSATISALAYSPLYALDQPYRFISAAFMHASFAHILCNMWALFVIGPSLERFLGSLRFALLYLASALAGSLASLAWMFLVIALASDSPDAFFSPQSVLVVALTPTVGASGAVFGLFGAELALRRYLKLSTRSLMVLLAINLLIGFVIPNIAWQAHLGGLLVGILAGWVYALCLLRGHKALATLCGLTILLVIVVIIALANGQVENQLSTLVAFAQNLENH